MDFPFGPSAFIFAMDSLLGVHLAITIHSAVILLRRGLRIPERLMIRPSLVALFITAIACALPSASGAVMTFDALPTGGSISTHTENGITLAALTPPDHFHPVLNPNNGTVGAFIFASDGSPQRITFAGGSPFSLVSLDLVTASGGARFTASNGTVFDVTTEGTVNFGPGFQDVTHVQLDVSFARDPTILIDNIQVIPEPAALALAALALTAAVSRRRWFR
jgi:hypothetical protein